ncbi:ABC transporter ATP-binding protein [Clostridioides difficile]|uniref:ABC transporter ATP-binding protein n=1 Tax=Clostridioides difficile TaxID=1496 RepID=UPI001FAE6AEC|nr:ABC transporter ATP-binding protein [Clostridioides difficile]MCJ0222600.1 ABC transporter ATP-binding protein [Clostridioides difficile]MCJ0429716.1 ABC transporter ATP-binding protein [Clostridioides difficile]MCJ0438403.1 ABC transporter ATP-binding protein [Clostridioides difficile]MCU6149112.1 ABC transporter ATP-binding protein [Clostridioides difficile]
MEMKIAVSNLSKRFGKKQALDNINLEIDSGMFSLLGRNGAGKTTFMRILATLLSKTEGSIHMCGVPIENTKEIRNMVGYLPQDFSMYPNMTVYKAMDYLAVLSDIPLRKRRKIIAKLLSKVNLTNYQNVKVKSLSGGMNRRLGIAQALIHNPRVLIVDEPTAGLDPEERIRFRNLLCEIANDRIVILSTHIVGDIEATCENVAILNSGKVIYNGSTEALAKLAEGKVYSIEVDKKDIENIKSRFIVIGMLTHGGKAILRIISDDKPFETAVNCNPTIEDGYMLIMGGDNI